jgi:hypothetical protein
MGGIDVIAYQVWWTDTVFDYEMLYNDIPPFQLNMLYTKTSSSDNSNSARAIVPGT